MKLLILYLLLCVISCQSIRNVHILDLGHNKFLSVDDSTFNKIEMWKKDSTACLGIRSGMINIELLDELQLMNYNYEEITKILGNPNSIGNDYIEANHDQNPNGPMYFDSTITLNYTLYKVCDTLVKAPYNQASSYWLLLFSKKSKKFLRISYGNIL